MSYRRESQNPLEAKGARANPFHFSFQLGRMISSFDSLWKAYG